MWVLTRAASRAWKIIIGLNFFKLTNPVVLYSPGSTSSSGFCFEILVEQHQLAPVLVCCISLFTSVTGPVAEFVWEKHRDQTTRKFHGNISETHQISWSGWTFDLETGSIEVVVTFECLNNQIVDCDWNEIVTLVLSLLRKEHYSGVNEQEAFT